MLANGLYAKAGGGTYYVRDGVQYGVPTWAEAARVFGDDWQSHVISGHDDERDALPFGDWDTTFGPTAVAEQIKATSGAIADASTPASGIPVLLIVAAIAAAAFLL